MMNLDDPLELSRRQVLRALGGGILVFALAPDLLAVQRDQGTQAPRALDAWIHIGTDGSVGVMTGKVEVGQNARTSLTQAVAEELRVPIESIHVTMGDTDLVPFDMGTFGSRTTPTMVPQIRKAAATAREALIGLAAVKWGVDRSTLRVQDGKVVATDGSRSATYGELAKGQPLEAPIPEGIALMAPDEWKTLGTPVPKVGGREIVTGRHRYTTDLSRPGALIAKVLRPPSFGATLESVDTSAAEAMSGVRVVREGGFVAVAAPSMR